MHTDISQLEFEIQEESKKNDIHDNRVNTLINLQYKKQSMNLNDIHEEDKQK